MAQSLFLPLVDPSYPHPASSMNPLREQGIWGDQKNTSYGFIYHEIGLLCPFFSIPVIFSILASFGTHSAPCKLLCPHPSPLYEPPIEYCIRGDQQNISFNFFLPKSCFFCHFSSSLFIFAIFATFGTLFAPGTPPYPLPTPIYGLHNGPVVRWDEHSANSGFILLAI